VGPMGEVTTSSITGALSSPCRTDRTAKAHPPTPGVYSLSPMLTFHGVHTKKVPVGPAFQSLVRSFGGRWWADFFSQVRIYLFSARRSMTIEDAGSTPPLTWVETVGHSFCPLIFCVSLPSACSLSEITPKRCPRKTRQSHPNGAPFIFRLTRRANRKPSVVFVIFFS